MTIASNISAVPKYIGAANALRRPAWKDRSAYGMTSPPPAPLGLTKVVTFWRFFAMSTANPPTRTIAVEPVASTA